MITRAATDVDNCMYTWRFTTSARSAWESILRSSQLGRGRSVLLPGYIGISQREGSGLFDPVEFTRTPYSFYPVGPRLQIDLDLIEDRLRTRQHPLMLAAHYFGFPHASMADLKALCQRYGTILVEDCAHVPGPWGSGTVLGNFGDMAFYSLHKMLPVKLGGVLCVNEGQMPLLDSNREREADTETLSLLLKADWNAIAQKRRANYEWLRTELVATDGVEIMYDLPAEIVPHDFPVIIQNGKREALYFALMDRGIPTTALYYEMIPALTPSEHPNSHALSRSILNLPVHQDTTQGDLIELTTALKSVMQTLLG